MGVEERNGGFDLWKIFVPALASKKDSLRKSIVASVRHSPKISLLSLTVTLALTSSLWQSSILKDPVVVIDDAKILETERIRGILREFGFVGEIAGPQVSRENKLRNTSRFSAFSLQDTNYDFYRKTHFAHCHSLLPAVVIRWGLVACMLF